MIMPIATWRPTGPGGPGNPRGPSSPFCPNKPCCPLGPGSPSVPLRGRKGGRKRKLNKKFFINQCRSGAQTKQKCFCQKRKE